MVTPDTPPCYLFEHQSQFPQCHPGQFDGGKEWEASVQSSIWLIQVQYANCWLSKNSNKIKACLQPSLQSLFSFSKSLNIFSQHYLLCVVGFSRLFLFSPSFLRPNCSPPVFCASLPLFAVYCGWSDSAEKMTRCKMCTLVLNLITIYALIWTWHLPMNNRYLFIYKVFLRPSSSVTAGYFQSFFTMPLQQMQRVRNSRLSFPM